VAPGDARRYANLTSGSGTGQQHTSRLVDAGLLMREDRGRYVLTVAGRLVCRLDAACHQPSQREPTPVDITVSSRASALDPLLPEGAELVLDLVRQLPAAGGGQSTIRIAREQRA
jgi:hypothetical protein